MIIANFTQHTATPEQIKDGVVELDETQKSLLAPNLNFKELPHYSDVMMSANIILSMARDFGYDAIMVGGYPALMMALGLAKEGHNIRIFFAHSDRVSEERTMPDGTVRKITVFKHIGLVEM